MVTETEVLKSTAMERGFELTGVIQAGSRKHLMFGAGYHAGMSGLDAILLPTMLYHVFHSLCQCFCPLLRKPLVFSLLPGVDGD